MTDDSQTGASSQHNRHAINQTDIDPSVRIHKNTHTSCVCSALARPTVIHSITVVVLVGVALSVMTSFIPSDNAKSLIPWFTECKALRDRMSLTLMC